MNIKYIKIYKFNIFYKNILFKSMKMIKMIKMDEDQIL